MADKPIIFSAPMVRALLAGTKTQTRRLLKPQPVKAASTLLPVPVYANDWSWPTKSHNCRIVSCKPYPPQGYLDDFPLPYAPGDRLYVREAFNAFQFSQDGDVAWPVKIPTIEECQEAEELGHRYGAPQIIYRESERARKWFADQTWRPSIHMPRWASRITLTVTEVRVQRLQDIEWSDAKAEGVDVYCEKFADLWNSLHGPDAWDANPWVFALTFTVRQGNIDA